MNEITVAGKSRAVTRLSILMAADSYRDGISAPHEFPISELVVLADKASIDNREIERSRLRKHGRSTTTDSRTIGDIANHLPGEGEGPQAYTGM